MNKKSILLGIILLLFSTFQSIAQIQVNDATVAPFTPQNLISNYFLGEGVEVVSVKYEGSAAAVGYFNNAQSRIGINRGIVLTNGFAATTGSGSTIRYGIDSDGINTANNDNKSNPTDKDIDDIIKASGVANVNSTNLSKYTIKFIPSADTLRFRYVFASEEYPEYVCDKYNDVFGFFISGPGISGPYENNGQNIALIPGTNLPVTINNINLGKGTSACPPKYPQYYNNNNNSNLQPVYDGFLKVFTAQAVVQPCKEYTIKLIIADVGDTNYDSGVFLEAKSFGTGSIRVDRITEASDNNIIEGCSPGAITFRLPKKADKDTPIKCNIIGSAINGVDYKLIATNLYFPKGDSILKVNIQAIQDGLFEGTETLGFDIQRDICNRDTFWFNIKDNNLKAVQRQSINDTTICQGQSINFDATIALTPPPNPSFTSTDSTTIKTIISGSSATPTILPILVSNVSPLQFTPSMIQSICVNLRHTWDDDIDLYLVAPNGQFIALSTDNGGDGDDMINTCFTPTAKDNITTGTAPFTGNWLPEEKFDELINGDNNPSNGEWKLLVIDDEAAGKEGKILNWSITFNSNYKIDYQWNTNQNITCTNCPKPTVTPKSDFSYIVKIQDVYGCAISDTAVVSLKDSLPAPNLLCGILTHNAISFGWIPIVDATGYEVSVNGGAWQNNALDVGYKVSSLSPNTAVTLSVRAIGGNCSAKTSSLVCNTLPCTTVTPKIDLLTQVTCKGKNDGEVKLIVTSGGTPPYKYSLGGKNNANGYFPNLSPGKYQVSIEDINGCPALANFQIIEPELLKAVIFADSASCPTAADALALIQVNGGTKPYSYQWNSGSNTDIAKGLRAGTHYVTVTDAAGCKLLDTIDISEPKPMNVRILLGDITCVNKNDGTLSANIESGGTPPFSYLWDTGTSLQPISKIIGLKPGLYQLTITDLYGCQRTSGVILDDANPIKIAINSTNPTCYNENTGQIAVSINGGVAPYKYLWDNKATTSSINNVKAGKYTVTVTDKNLCDLVTPIDLIGPDSIVIQKTITPLVCFGESNAAIALNVLGGNGTYIYNWSNNEQTKDISNLKSGSYTLTVTDNKSCIAKDSIYINAPDSIEINAILVNSDCSANNSGSINTSIKGGVAPYAFAWSNTNGFSSINQNINNLSSGNYTLTVTDNKGCSKVQIFTIKQPTTFSTNIVITDVKCKDGATGAIKVNVSGGTIPFTYNWSNGLKTDNPSNLKAGNYSVTISDGSGCSTSSSIEVLEPDSLKITIAKVDSLCFGSKGEATATAFGGIAPYTFEWSSGGTSQTEKNLINGTYQVTVSDKNTCSATIETDIFIFNELKISLLETAPSCNNGTDGKIEVEKISYNTAAENLNTFNYNWSNNAFTKSIDNTKGGNIYTVTVTSSKGCSATQSIKNTNPTATAIILNKSTNPSCAKGNDGAIECAGTGGTAPYDFVWSNGVNSPNISGLAQGTYSVTLTDNKGCSATQNYNLVQPNPFVIKLIALAEKCAGVANGSAEAQIIGGSAPFQFAWSNGDNTQKINKLAAGNYSVTISDAQGCVQNGTVSIDSAPALSATVVESPVHCGGKSDGTFSILPKGGTPPYLYSVNGDAFNGQYKRIGLQANIYEITVKDANDCLFDLAATITEPIPIEIDLGKDTALQFGESYRIPTQIKNVIGDNPKLSWFPDDSKFINCINCQNPIVSPRISTLYTLTVKDSLGCTASKTINIVIKINTNIAVPTGFSPNGDGENDLLVVHGDAGATILNFRIYDRWGNTVYENNDFPINDKSIGWNGFFRNESMPTGNYVWILSVRFKDGSIEHFKGSTMLIR